MLLATPLLLAPHPLWDTSTHNLSYLSTAYLPLVVPLLGFRWLSSSDLTSPATKTSSYSCVTLWVTFIFITADSTLVRPLSTGRVCLNYGLYLIGSHYKINAESDQRQSLLIKNLV